MPNKVIAKLIFAPLYKAAIVSKENIEIWPSCGAIPKIQGIRRDWKPMKEE